MAWQLLRERSPRGERLRRRIAVLAGAGVFVLGMLVAAGLAMLVLFLLVVALFAAVIAGIVWGLARRGVPRMRVPNVDVSGARRFGARVARETGPAVAAVQRRARDVTPVVTGFVERAGERARAIDWSGWPYAGAERPPGAFDRDAQHRRAVRLNARGAQLRTEGRLREAADMHGQALAIFRALGDSRGEAPTLNSLALALDAAGDTDAAVQHFEEALAILHELDDERHEGKVIANLGFTMLRHGDDDRARELLESALQKLDPNSRAAKQVVEQLQRAS